MSWLVASLTDWPEEECQEWGSWEYIIELFWLATVMLERVRRRRRIELRSDTDEA